MTEAEEQPLPKDDPGSTQQVIIPRPSRPEAVLVLLVMLSVAIWAGHGLFNVFGPKVASSVAEPAAMVAPLGVTLATVDVPPVARPGGPTPQPLAVPTDTPISAAVSGAMPVSRVTPSATPVSRATPSTTPAGSGTPTRTPAALDSPIPSNYVPYTVNGLAARPYGGGELVAVQNLGVTESFTRTLFTYPSDGLTVYGYADVPRAAGPLPVVILIHGYIEPDRYVTLDYTTSYADALARAGYLVLHPNLRNFPPSDEGPDLFRTGLAVDVLNLIALVRQQGGRSGLLSAADPNRIGLWGHSMGGGIALRVITVNTTDVKAALLWAAVSGDDLDNFNTLYKSSAGTRGVVEYNTPADIVQQIAPINYLDRIQAAVSIHHGLQDKGIPSQTSSDLCRRLQALSKPVECFDYPDQAHLFDDVGFRLLAQRSIDFFRRTL